MSSLSVLDAQKLVRKNLDEVDPNGSWMLTDDTGSSSDYGDNKSLDVTIARLLPEAINAVHLAAPVAVLDWDAKELTYLSSEFIDAERETGADEPWYSFCLELSKPFLRLVSFKASDSDITVMEAVPRSSVEGRKQANEYIRGRYDRPRLVFEGGSSVTEDNSTTYNTYFKYYSLKTSSGYCQRMSIIERQVYSADTDATTYTICSRVQQNIIDYLTALVLEAYSDQRADFYHQKANIFPTI